MEFENLEEFYSYVENDEDVSLFDSTKFKGSEILKLRDKIEDEKSKKKCSYELFVNDFTIKKNELIPHHKIDDDAYPSLSLFDDNFEYIKTRSETVKNPKYKSKYNHLLWLSPVKRIDFAQQAIESYFSILKSSKFSGSDKLLNKSFTRYFENVFLLSQSINYKKDDIIEFFIEVLSTDKISDFAKCSVMKFIVENIKKNDKIIFQKFFDYSNEKINGLESKALEFYLNLLIILSRKVGLDPSEFHEQLGDYHLKQIKDNNKQGFVTHFFYLNALKEYKKANNKNKIEETTVLLEQSKKEIDLKRVRFEIKDEDAKSDLSKFWESFTANITSLTENGDSRDIYKYLISEILLPNAEDLHDDFKSPMLDLVSVMTFDINGNLSKKKSGGINSYAVHMRILAIPQIILTFSKGIICGKVSYESFIDFLKNDTWYAEDFTYTDLNGERRGFDWIELLAPSLQSFFLQMEVDLKLGKDSRQGYILALDSLVLKFEGLLREFSKLAGAQIIEVKDDATEARISFEKLLDNEKVKELIPQNDITFFKYLFTSDGMNLRNNVAHSFFKTENYNSTTIMLLLIAFLKLGNFKYMLNEEDS